MSKYHKQCSQEFKEEAVRCGLTFNPMARKFSCLVPVGSTWKTGVFDWFFSWLWVGRCGGSGLVFNFKYSAGERACWENSEWMVGNTLAAAGLRHSRCPAENDKASFKG